MTSSGSSGTTSGSSRKESSSLSAIADEFRSYGIDTFGIDQPTYAQICSSIGEYPEVLELLADCKPEARQPNLLFAAVRFLLLGGLDHPLAEVYVGTSTADPVEVFADLVSSNREPIAELLATRRTQTNEVGRGAVLALALADAQRRSGQDLAWIDLGASGGLNLNVDQFAIRYRHGSLVQTTGDLNASVQLQCELRGETRPIAADPIATVIWRVGIDRAPIDVGDPDEARWLQACIWPNQQERLSRLQAAIQLANQHPPRLIRSDAVAGLAQAMTEAPGDAAMVVTTTWVWFYLPEQTRHDLLELFRNAGRPVWWYSLEGRGVVEELGQPSTNQLSESHLGRIEFDGNTGERSDVLATCHPHGTWLAWSAAHT